MSDFNTRFGGSQYPPLQALNFNDLTWVGTSGKLDVSSAASGSFSLLAATYSIEIRDAPFGYMPLFNARGQPHWESYSSMDFQIRYTGDPADSGVGIVNMAVGVISATDLTGAGYWGGVEHSVNRADVKTSVCANGASRATGAAASPGALARRINGSLSFGGSGPAEVNTLMENTSQVNARSFQSHADQLYLCFAFENAGCACTYSGVSVKYRLNK